MANLAVTYTFAPLQTILSSSFNTNYNDIVSYINNRNSASAAWEQLSVSGNAAIVGTLTLTGGATLGSTLDIAGVTTVASGTVSAPGLGWRAEPTTGIFRGGTGRIDVTVLGSNVLTLNATVLDFSGLTQARGVNGSVTVPTYSFTNESGLGWYRNASHDARLAANGVDLLLCRATGVALLGTTTNDSTSTGYVGEYVSSTVSTMASMGSTGVWQDVTSISLTAGDWDVVGQTYFDVNTANTFTTGYGTAVSTSSGNTTTDHVNGSNVMYSTPTTIVPAAGSTIHYRVSIATTTNVYLKTVATVGSGTPKSLGTIRARRVR